MFWGCSKMFRCKARKKPNREAYNEYTLSGAVCSATQQMSVFQQPHSACYSISISKMISMRQGGGFAGHAVA
jgi:hypothetical protein